MQNGSESESSAEKLLISGKLLQSFSDSAEEKIVKRGLILINDRAQSIRYGKNDVEVRDIEQIVFLIVDPTLFCQRLTFRTMPVAARVV